jgi:membrane protein
MAASNSRNSRQASATSASDRKEPGSPTRLGKSGWIQTFKRALGQFKHDDITDRAAALTYFGVLAIFPGMLVLVSIMGMLGQSAQQSILSNINGIAPGGAKTFLTGVIHQVQGRAGAASAAAIVGILVALWSASGYVAAFMRAMNAVYEVDEGRPIWKTAPIRLGVTLVTVVVLVISAVMVAVTGPIASRVGQALGIGNTGVLIWDIVKWPVLIVIISMLLSLLYWASPNVKQPGTKWITPGGIVAVVLWIIASALFGVYVSFSGSYNKTYGTLATVIIFLVWLWITNIAILLGAEFNAEMQHQRLIEAGLPEKLQPFHELRDTKKLDPEEKARVEEAAAEREQTLRQ